MKDWFVWIAVALIAPIPLGIGLLIGLPLALLLLVSAFLIGMVAVFRKGSTPNPDAGKAKASAQVFMRCSHETLRRGASPPTR